MLANIVQMSPSKNALGLQVPLSLRTSISWPIEPDAQKEAEHLYLLPTCATVSLSLRVPLVKGMG